MFPKVIHYCWFGRNPLPPLSVKCIKSWKTYLPDYEIREWNEDNFDVNIIPYTKEAYQVKKYAFVSDYARFWILYNYGGLYFDTDVEVIKPLDDIIAKGAFMGCQLDKWADNEFPSVNPGLGLGAVAGNSFYKEMLDFYEQIHFQDADGNLNLKTVVQYTTDQLCKHGLEKQEKKIQQVAGILIYAKEYFCPLDVFLQMNMTDNSRTIHHFSSSWLPWHKQFIKKIKRVLGYSFSAKIRRFFVCCGLLKR